LDLVFTSNFFEHLPSKEALTDTLEQAKRCLRPKGRLIAMGPNIRFVGGAYWDFWDHHLPLTDHSLAEALRVRGFEIERVVDRFLPYTMVNTRPAPPLLVYLYLKTPFAWRVFGKQFLIVARRP
jgi:SAM-dependent methyltransferase